MGQGPDPDPMDTSDGFWKINTMVSLAAIFTPAVIMALILGYSGILFNLMQNLDYIKLKVFSSKQKERKELLSWLKENILRTSRRRCKVTEVEVWRDGSLLCSIINTVVPEACPNPSAHTNTPPKHGQALAFKYLDVVPVFSDEELKNSSLTLQQEKKLYHYLCSVYHAIKQLNVAVPAMKFSTEYVARGMGLVVARQHTKSVFYIYPVPNSKNCQQPADVEVTIKGPYNTKGHITIPSILHYYQKWQRPTDYTRALYLSSKLNNISPTTQGTSFLRKLSLKHTPAVPHNDSYIPIKVSMSQSRAKVSYTPRSSGVYEVCLATRNGHVIGSPFTVPVEPATTGVPSNDSDSEQEEDTEDNFIEKKKKVISRIVDFIDEKMMLLPDGTLVKIENDVSKGNQSILNKENILNNNSENFRSINQTAALETEFFLEHTLSEDTKNKNNDMNILQSITEHHFDVLNRNANATYLNKRESSSLHKNYEENLDYTSKIQTTDSYKSEDGKIFKNKHNNIKYQKNISSYPFRQEVFNKPPHSLLVNSTEKSFLIDNKIMYKANEASPWEIDPVQQELSDESNITATDILTNTIKDGLNAEKSLNLENEIHLIYDNLSEKNVHDNKIVCSNLNDTGVFDIFNEDRCTGEFLDDTYISRQGNNSSGSSEDWIQITESIEENNNDNKQTNEKVMETVCNRTPTPENEEINKMLNRKSSFVLLNNENDDFHLTENNQQLSECTHSKDKYRNSVTPSSEYSEEHDLDSIGSNVDYKSIQHTSHEYLSSLTPSSNYSEEHDIDTIETGVNFRDIQQESHSTSLTPSSERNEELDVNIIKKRNVSVKNILDTSNEDLSSFSNFYKISEESEPELSDISETERNDIYTHQKYKQREDEEYNFFHENTLHENDTNNSFILINSDNRVSNGNSYEWPIANESNQYQSLISTTNIFISTWEGTVEDTETEKLDSMERNTNIQYSLAHTPEFHDAISFQNYEHQSVDVNLFKDTDSMELSNADFTADDLYNALTLKQDCIQMEVDNVFDSNEFILVKQHTSDSFVLLNDHNCATYVSSSGSKQDNDILSHVYQEEEMRKSSQSDTPSFESDFSIQNNDKTHLEVVHFKEETSDEDRTKLFSVLSSDDQNFIREIDVISANSSTPLSQFSINQNTHFNEYVDESHFQGNEYSESENSEQQFSVAKEPDLLHRSSTSTNTNNENLNFQFTTYPNGSSLDSIIGTPVKDIIEMFSSTDKLNTPSLSPSPTYSRSRSESNAHNTKFSCTTKQECSSKTNKDENDPDLVKCHISSPTATNLKNVNAEEIDTDSKMNDLTGDDLKNAIKCNLERALSCKFANITSSVHSNKHSEKFTATIDKSKQDAKSSYDNFSCLNTKEKNTKIFGIVDKQKQFWQEKLEEIAKANYNTYKELKRNTHLNKSNCISKVNEFKNGIKLCTESKEEYLKPFDGIVKSKKIFFESKYFSNENKNIIQKCHSEGNIYMRKCSKSMEFESVSESIRKEDEIIKFPSVEERKAQLKRAYSMNTTPNPSAEINVNSKTPETIYKETNNPGSSPSYKEIESAIDICAEEQINYPSFKKTSVRRKARFRRAKLFFQSLEGSQPKTNVTGVEKHSPVLLMHRSTSAPCLNTKLSLMREDSSDYFVMKGKKISERFQVNDLFRDILGDRDKRFLGIPNRKAVVASLASLDSDSSRAEFDSDDNEPDLKHFAERPKKRRRRRHMVQGFHEDYPHPPTTDRWRYRPRSSIAHTSLIPRSILLATSLDRIYF